MPAPPELCLSYIIESGAPDKVALRAHQTIPSPHAAQGVSPTILRRIEARLEVVRNSQGEKTHRRRLDLSKVRELDPSFPGHDGFGYAQALEFLGRLGWFKKAIPEKDWAGMKAILVDAPAAKAQEEFRESFVRFARKRAAQDPAAKSQTVMQVIEGMGFKNGVVAIPIVDGTFPGNVTLGELAERMEGKPSDPPAKK